MKASLEQIARSLEGNWQEDLLFVLKQEQKSYEFCQKQMAECDRQLEQYFHQREDHSQGAPLPEEKRKERLKRKKGNKPQFDLRTGLFRMTGVDLTQIDSIDVATATTILSETGTDMSKWKTENHFVSWLWLCPDNRISGDKIVGKGRLPTKNRVSIALKVAANTLRVSNTYLDSHAGTDDSSEVKYVDKMVNGNNPKWIRPDKLVNSKESDGTGVDGDQTKATLEMGKMFTDAKIFFAVAQIKQLIAAGR